MSTLYIDCGSTKARWILSDNEIGTSEIFSTPGFNASALNTDQIIEAIRPAVHLITRAASIRFYGAGCREGEPAQRVMDAFRSITPEASILAVPDIYAAIHALAPTSDAIVAIVGTGVNAVAVSEGKIIDSVPSTGYILGDYGSGAALGRELMSLYISRRLPDNIVTELEKDYSITPAMVIDAVYRGTSPRGFLGSFAPFILTHASDTVIADMISKQMRLFVDINLRPLLQRHSFPIYLSGSIACYFRHFIEQSLAEICPEAHIDRVIASPLDTLS